MAAPGYGGPQTTPKTRRPLASDNIGDDQRIKHSDDDGPGLTRPIYYCTVGLL